MTNDLISKRSVLDALQAERILHRHAFHKDTASLAQHEEEFSDCMRVVWDVPFVDAEPVRHGRWIDDCTNIICSECKAEYSDEIVFMNSDCETADLSYCPNCGAKMDGEKEN